jgi:hypothetical protein
LLGALVLAAGVVCASPPAVAHALHAARRALCAPEGSTLSADFCTPHHGPLALGAAGWAQGGSLAMPVVVVASHAVGCLCGRLLVWSMLALRTAADEK